MRRGSRRLCSDLRPVSISRYPPRASDSHRPGLHLSRERVCLQAKICIGVNVKQRERSAAVMIISNLAPVIF